VSYGLKRTVEPADTPVSLTEAKIHLGIPDAVTLQDAYILNLIKAATKYAEDWTGRQFFTATWRLSIDRFPSGEIYLPRSPVQSVTSVVYVAPDGTATTEDTGNYVLMSDYDPARIMRTPDTSWPSVRWQPGAVAVTYVAGWATVATIPQSIKQAILILVGQWFNNREASTPQQANSIPMAVEALLQMTRVGDEFTCYSQGH
jgi:uncharacterized phiE125 gp8 family phage protein